MTDANRFFMVPFHSVLPNAIRSARGKNRKIKTLRGNNLLKKIESNMRTGLANGKADHHVSDITEFGVDLPRELADFPRTGLEPGANHVTRQCLIDLG